MGARGDPFIGASMKGSYQKANGFAPTEVRKKFLVRFLEVYLSIPDLSFTP